MAFQKRPTVRGVPWVAIIKRVKLSPELRSTVHFGGRSPKICFLLHFFFQEAAIVHESGNIYLEIHQTP